MANVIGERMLPMVLLYIGAFLFGHFMGACLGAGAGSLFGTAPNGGYVFRLVRGTVFGSTTIIAALTFLGWFAMPAPPSFQLVLVGSFPALVLLNRVQLAAAIARNRGNARVDPQLRALAWPRLVQDLAASVSALITLIFVHIVNA
ncbi:MAG TPA: hypothetical protein VGQ36_06200 [Thermoanaerobaculia bacterium]|nr:hypothetical protein [Thermoanaerobaculia bacterium]